MRNYEQMIKPFSVAMLTQMAGNDSRGFGYRNNIQFNEPVPVALFEELELCVAALKSVATEGEHNNPSLIEQRMAILERAADVANMAMLIALNTGSLTLVHEEGGVV